MPRKIGWSELRYIRKVEMARHSIEHLNHKTMISQNGFLHQYIPLKTGLVRHMLAPYSSYSAFVWQACRWSHNFKLKIKNSFTEEYLNLGNVNDEHKRKQWIKHHKHWWEELTFSLFIWRLKEWKEGVGPRIGHHKCVTIFVTKLKWWECNFTTLHIANATQCNQECQTPPTSYTYKLLQFPLRWLDF